MANRPELAAEYERGRAAGREASKRPITNGPITALFTDGFSAA